VAFLAIPELAAVAEGGAAAGEAGAATRGAGAARGAGARGRSAGKRPRKSPVPDPRVTDPGSEAARQRQAVEDVKAARKPEFDPSLLVDPQSDDPNAPQPAKATSSGPSTPKFLTNQDGSPGWWPKAGGTQRTANAGGGFLLGTIGYVVALTYLRGGSAGVKQLLRAKFLNKTEAK
jgi:hypothetical protein